MKLTRQDVLKLAKLSRLNLSDAEIEQYQNDLSEILEYVKQLEQVDVNGIKPTYQVTGLTSQSPNATREDVLTEQISQEQLFKNVPEVEKDQIKVKRMIG